uniref:hypothetical protein n=1 Tax=Yoonia sp. TaxID=2212373 RepID=UPI0040488573
MDLQQCVADNHHDVEYFEQDFQRPACAADQLLSAQTVQAFTHEALSRKKFHGVTAPDECPSSENRILC